MTQHEEAVRLANAKHIAGDVYQVTGAELAALIAEVRRQERAYIGAQLDAALTGEEGK